MGEVGKAIYKVLSDQFSVDGLENGEESDEKYDVIHMCFPHSHNFFLYAKQYEIKYLNPGGLVIIHSTLPMGLTKMMGRDYVHSPIRGVHPDLEGGIRTFVKYFGGVRANEATWFFIDAGIKTEFVYDACNTEALKMWSTTYYGWNIIFEKMVHRYCKKHGLDFDFVYTHANNTYNEGYKALGRDEVLRPVLKHFPGEIGGHCVLPNAKLLGTRIGRFITKMSKRLKGS